MPKPKKRWGCQTGAPCGDHYYFGGDSGDDLNSILRLSGTSWTWSKVGQLNSPREGHGVISVGNIFTVVGGMGTQNNEACVLENEQVTCTELSSSLTDYFYWPSLYLVNDNNGNC